MAAERGLLAELYLAIKGDDKALGGTLSAVKNMVGRIVGMGATAGVGFVTTMVSAAVAAVTTGAAIIAGALLAGVGGFLAGIGTVAGITVPLASMAEEAASKFKFVFKDAAKETAAELDKFSKSAGRSVEELKDMASAFGSLLGPMGFSSKQTGEMSTKLTKLATDLSSFYNISEADASRAIFSGLVGESEPLRRLGVQINAVRIEEEALRLGLIKSKKDLDAKSKAQAIYSLILKDTATAQGDAERTAGSFANQSRALFGVLKDIGVEVGQIFLPAATAIVSRMRAWVEVLRGHRPLFEKWGGLIGEMTANIMKAFESLTTLILGKLSPAFNSFFGDPTGDGGGGFANFVTKVLDEMAFLSGHFDLVFALMSAEARLRFTEVLKWAHDNFGDIIAFSRGTFAAIIAGMAVFSEIVISKFEMIGDTLGGIFSGIQRVVGVVLKVIATGVDSVIKRVGILADGIGVAMMALEAFKSANLKAEFEAGKAEFTKGKKREPEKGIADIAAAAAEAYTREFNASKDLEESLGDLVAERRKERDAALAALDAARKARAEEMEKAKTEEEMKLGDLAGAGEEEAKKAGKLKFEFTGLTELNKKIQTALNPDDKTKRETDMVKYAKKSAETIEDSYKELREIKIKISEKPKEVSVMTGIFH